MLGQLIISGWQVFTKVSLYSGVSFAVVIFLWIFTFTHFAPLHAKISASQHTEETLSQLISRNWLRTVAWSLLCAYSVSKVLH